MIITNLKELQKLKNRVKPEEFEEIIANNTEKEREALKKYGIDKLIEYGIRDIGEISKPVTDIYKIKELAQKRPLDLIDMGLYSESKKAFIEKYGFDNMIALDKETSGMFSYEIYVNIFMERPRGVFQVDFNNGETYFTVMACAEAIAPEFKTEGNVSYEQFKDRMYELLKNAREEEGGLREEYFPSYDFIQGDFRKEHPDIFIDENIDEDLKTKFYWGYMEAEDVRKHPELIEILRKRELRNVFSQKMFVDFEEVDENEREYGKYSQIPKKVNMAEYLSKKIGQENFLKICAEYGQCLDDLGMVTFVDRANGKLSEEEEEIFYECSKVFKDIGKPQVMEMTEKNVRKAIEDAIYREIVENELEYYEYLPESFKKAHEEIFIEESVPVELRKKFYRGKLTYEDIKNNPYLKEILMNKNINIGFREIIKQEEKIGSGKMNIWRVLSKEEILEMAQEYGKYLEGTNALIFEEEQSAEEKRKALENDIERRVINRYTMYDDKAPEFMKEKHPELFLDDDAPEELKLCFYDGYTSQKEEFSGSNSSNYIMMFQRIKEHPEWLPYLKEKNLKRAFPENYKVIFNMFDNDELMKIGLRYPETVRKIVGNHKEEILRQWYKATGGKFLPHYVIMSNFPVKEIDSFLENSKKWSHLMKVYEYNFMEEAKTAMLKAAYCMGVFKGSDEGYSAVLELFTGIPSELTEKDYNEILERLGVSEDCGDIICPFEHVGNYKLFVDAYKPCEEPKEGEEQEKTQKKYVLSFNKQKDKKKAKEVRRMLENINFSKTLNFQKAHQIFDSFAMKYNPDFVKFFEENIEEIISSQEHIGNIANIQRQFEEITKTNSARKITLEVAEDYIKSIAYDNIDIGNEKLAEYTKIAGYSQDDFEKLQKIYNEAEMREYSSIPRVHGQIDGYTYEILRNDEPLALVIGVLTDCCQKLYGAGETSMLHSVLSQDGRVFIVRDEKGRIVAQSWIWRNQNTCCFDNIEIPNRIFDTYQKEHPEKKKADLAKGILEAYKKRGP